MSRVFFLIRSLERGGAERQLVELARGLAQDGFVVTVCTFYEGGALRGELEAVPGVELLSLGKRGRWDLATFLWRLHHVARTSRPDIIHGYLPVANELAVLVARLIGAKSVLGIRSSNMDFSRYDEIARRTFQLGAVLSRFADAIIVNSEAGRAHHVQLGYREDRMVVIPNGIDYDRYLPDPDGRVRVRREWGIDASDKVVGLVARADPKKDHETFLRAAAQVIARRSDVRFVCVGDATPERRRTLLTLTRQLSLGDAVIWAGLRSDMRDVYSAFDVSVLCSAFGEGFPNAVAEAMAATRPCVVTAVGDAAVVVGDTGVVTPPKDPTALAEGIEKLLALTPEELAARGQLARERIVTEFHRRRLVESTKKVFADLLVRNG